MRRTSIGLIALTMMTAMLLALPAAGAGAAAGPNGKVYFGIELIDPDQSPQVLTIGAGDNPVPIVWVDYNVGVCRTGNGTRKPAVITAIGSVSPVDNDGMRIISSEGSGRLTCAGAGGGSIDFEFELTYDMAADRVEQTLEQGGPVTLNRICNGQPVPGVSTVLGTGGADVLRGSDGMDIIDGRGGADDIKGRGGSDIICGGGGRDTVEGGPGLDVIIGGSGRDEISGNSGVDVILGGSNPADKARERLRGGKGNDLLLGWLGRDKLIGGTGDDALFAGPDGDVLKGGSGFDECLDTDAGQSFSCETTAP